MITSTGVKALIEQGGHLFSSRQTLMTLWQEIADNFYVERANFTRIRVLGEEFADHLDSSYPLLVRRELANAFSSMLRHGDWFSMTIEDDDNLSIAAREWLEMATYRQRRAMYDRRSQFVRATKEGDHDFAAFGQCVIEREIDWKKTPPALLYRCWHLRDVAWAEKYDGAVGEVHRKWKPTAGELVRQFGDKAHESVVRAAKKSPFQKINCRVVVIETEELHDELLRNEFKHPWARIVIDVENDTLMRHSGQWTSGMTIPRWQTASGSQYGYSPATTVGLSDARLLQSMTRTLLEAGEMAVRPPMIATQEAIRSDISLYPGGITWVDQEYDQREGRVLQPLTQDFRGISFGMAEAQDVRQMLASAFYLTKLSMPAPGQGGMSPLEVSERIGEYIRDALPLFEPMEQEYNGAICEDTFDALLRVGVFGSMQEIPSELSGANIRFLFSSPLHDAEDRKKGATFMESKELINAAAGMDSTSAFILDTPTALRESLKGIGTPAVWLNTKDEADRAAAQLSSMNEAQMGAETLQAGGDAATSVGNAVKVLTQPEAA